MMTVDVDELALEALEASVAEQAARRARWDLQVSKYPVLTRGLADYRDKVGWAKARSGRIGASDAAGFSKIESAPRYLAAKLSENFGGNTYTQRGHEQEPAMLAAFHLEQNNTLFHSAGNERHVCTPDGIKLGLDGEVLLAQCKTTTKPFLDRYGAFHIPPAYERQMNWECYVMGAKRELFIWWLLDHDGNRLTPEPESEWFYPDESKIHDLITIADIVLAGMDAAATFTREMENA